MKDKTIESVQEKLQSDLAMTKDLLDENIRGLEKFKTIKFTSQLLF